MQTGKNRVSRELHFLCRQHVGLLTSDKHVGRVRLVARLGGDPQGVQALILLVEVREGESGAVPAPVHVRPLGRLQQDACDHQGETERPTSVTWPRAQTSTGIPSAKTGASVKITSVNVQYFINYSIKNYLKDGYSACDVNQAFT